MAERWHDDCIALRPNVVSILIGTNDVHAFLDQRKKDPAATFDLEGWTDAYRRLLDQTRDSLPGVRLVLCTPFVARVGRIGEAADYAERELLVRQLAERVTVLAEEYGAVLVPFDRLFDTLRAEHPTSNPAYWIWDGIHPTPAGHRRMCEMWLDETHFLNAKMAK